MLVFECLKAGLAIIFIYNKNDIAIQNQFKFIENLHIVSQIYCGLANS